MTVRGMVQGVWFRDSCRQVALAAGVSGWVRNEPDGSVAAVLEGAPAAVDSVVEWMRKGPRRAVVEDVEVSSIDSTGLTGFAVS